MAIIRLATRTDLEAIRTIYNYYVEHSTCTYQIQPETTAERLAWFVERGPTFPVTVVEDQGTVLGWGALSPWKTRCGYAQSAEASIYIHHDHQRRGFGKALLRDLLARAKTLGFHTILGGASADQEASLQLQYACGFKPVAHLKEVGYKFGRWLDVIYTQYMLDEEP